MTQVETLVALRLVAPQDRKAVEAWIVDQADKAEGAALVASLPRLATGEGWIWSPEAGVLERAQFPRIRTFELVAAARRGRDPACPAADRRRRAAGGVGFRFGLDGWTRKGKRAGSGGDRGRRTAWL